MIERGADGWNWGLHYACSGGHLNIVNLMIEKGADNWNSGLSGACMAYNTNIMGLMIKNGAIYCNYCKRPMEKHKKDIVDKFIWDIHLETNKRINNLREK